MLAWGIEEWIDDHAKQKNKNVAKQDHQRMAHEEVFKALARLGVLKLLFRHDWKGTNVGTAQLGIVRVVMVMRAAPDAAGTQGINAIEAHEYFRRTRSGQDGSMLLVMINHKQPDHQESG